MKLSKIIHEGGIAPIGVIASKCGVGKSSLLMVIAIEAIIEGKTVLYITDEHPKYLSKRFDDSSYDLSNGKLIIRHQFKNPELELELLLNENKIDLIIIDDLYLFDKKRIKNLILFLRAKEINTILSMYLSVKVNNKNSHNDRYELENEIFYLTDYAGVVAKKDDYSLLEKIKYFLMFWKPRPNIEISKIKNRNGAHLKKLISVNFKTLKIK